MRIIFTLIFLLTSAVVFAQEATKTHHEETGFFEEEKVVSAYDFVFQTFEETKELWKLDITGILLNPPAISSEVSVFSNDAVLSYERKIGKVFSINNSFGLGYSYRTKVANTTFIGSRNLRLNIGIQPRWYFQMKKRIAAGASANNLSGNYIGLGWTYFYTRGNDEFRNNIQNISLKYGIQRRIFNRGFIDIQIGPQYTFGEFKYLRQQGEERVQQLNYWRLVSQVKLGFVFGQSQLGLEAEKRCDVFQCFEERKGMFKLDLLNAFNMFFDANQSIIGTVNLAYEFKLTPALSINNELNIGYIFNSNDLFRFDNFFLTMTWTTQGRYYYDFKKRIAAGKSSNNLSGNYFGLQAKIYDSSFFSGSDLALTVSPIWGLQRTIFEKGYIDYSVGFNLFAINSNDILLENRTLLGSRGFNLNLISQLRIGFRF